MAVSRRRTASKPAAGAKTAPRGVRSSRRRSAAADNVLNRDDAIALAQSISGSRDQFAAAFLQAQRGRSGRVEFEAVATSMDGIAAFARAFLRAAELGWLDQLCINCIKALIVDDDFREIAQPLMSDRHTIASLQRVVDPARGTRNQAYYDRMPEVFRQVCQVEIDGQAIGTGFLIRPDLVMTAHHVVRPLLSNDNSERAGSAPRLRVRFDYSSRAANGQLDVLDPGFTCPAADPWLVATSPCTDDELFNRLPKNRELLNNFWDFAVIRLAETPGMRYGLAIVDRTVRPGHRLTILQHAARRPVETDQGPVRGFLGSGGFRVVHGLNTDEGASGSPCLNDRFEVVCLHQAQMPDEARRRPARPADGGDKANRAVPMKRILAMWDPAKAAQAPTSLRRLVTVDTATVPQHPVFGRYNLQAWIERASASRTDDNYNRFLTVAGPSGSGKSFTLDILKAMLNLADHCVLACKASDWTSETTATGLVEKYFLSPMKATAELPPIEQVNTSDNAWLNYHFVGPALNAIEQARKGRTVWLVIDDLDRVVLPDQGQVRKLLDLLYARAPQTPWLRFVLLGLEAVPVPGTLQYTERDFPGPRSEAELAVDVTEYLARRFETHNIQIDRGVVAASAATVVKLAIGQNAANISADPEMLGRLVDGVMAFERTCGLRPKTP